MEKTIFFILFLFVGVIIQAQTISYKGSSIGVIEPDGDVYANGSRVGAVEDDGDVYYHGSRVGDCDGVKREWAAVFFFFFFLDLDSEDVK